MRRILPISFAVALTLTVGTADAWAKANQAPPAITAPTSKETAREVRALVEETMPLLGATIDDDLIDYAQREAQAGALEDFNGGDVIVIGGSALALVVLVVLLIVLL